MAGTPSAANVTPARRVPRTSVRGSRTGRDDILDTPSNNSVLRSRGQPVADGITPITDLSQQPSTTSITPDFRIGEPVSLQPINQDVTEGLINIDSSSTGLMDGVSNNVVPNNGTVSDLDGAHTSIHNG